MIAFAGVHFGYGRDEILRGVSFELHAAETLALVGPSGSGKSTIIRLALGLACPTAGSIAIGGKPASGAHRTIIAPEARRLGVVFQDLALWPHLTVEANLAFPLAARGIRDPDRVGVWLERVGLAHKARRYPGELSGGERQRVAIARALVTDPAAILLDEPLASLDIALRRELVALFDELLSRRAVLYVSHEPREVGALADRIAVIEAGRIVQHGTAEELRAAPATAFVAAIAADLAGNPARHGHRREPL